MFFGELIILEVFSEIDLDVEYEGSARGRGPIMVLGEPAPTLIGAIAKAALRERLATDDAKTILATAIIIVRP